MQRWPSPDRNSLAGVVRAHIATREVGLKLIIGALITPIDAPPLLLWVMNRKGYAQLARLLTLGRRSAPKGECRLLFDDVAKYSEGLLAGVLLNAGLAYHAKPRAADYRDLFADRCYAVAELHRGLRDRHHLRQMQHLARETGLPLVAANDVHYHIPQRRPLHDVLAATRHGCTVAELGERRFPNAERHLKSPAQMRELFAEAADSVLRTSEVADRCSFSLDELRFDIDFEHERREKVLLIIRKQVWERYRKWRARPWP